MMRCVSRSRVGSMSGGGLRPPPRIERPAPVPGVPAAADIPPCIPPLLITLMIAHPAGMPFSAPAAERRGRPPRPPAPCRRPPGPRRRAAAHRGPGAAGALPSTTMNDDWRVRVDLHDDGFAHRLGESLQAEELESDLRRSFADRVVISTDGHEMFLYAADRPQAEAAQRVVERVGADHGWTLETELRRWHPIAEIWEDPDNPEPTTAGQERTEEQIRSAGERRESAEEGYPAIEVRVTCASRSEASALSERLDEEGIANVH